MYSDEYLLKYIHLCESLQLKQFIWIPLICLIGLVITVSSIIVCAHSITHHYPSGFYAVLSLAAALFFCAGLSSFGDGSTNGSGISMVENIPIRVMPIRNAEQDLRINHNREEYLPRHEHLRYLDNKHYRQSAKHQDDDLYRHQTTHHYYEAFMRQSRIIERLKHTDEHGHTDKDSDSIFHQSGYHKLTPLHYDNTHFPYVRVGYLF